MPAEINVFFDEGAGHIKLIVPDEPRAYADGSEAPPEMPDPAKIVAAYNGIAWWLADSKHKLGREKPRFGGGGGRPQQNQATKMPDGEDAKCPKCKGPMWDNMAENDKREKAGEKMRPDFKCKDKDCDGLIWRPKGGWVVTEPAGEAP